MTDLAARPFGSLSTGQQRLALLGRALVHDPATLILDEPCAGLDFGASAGIMRRIRTLAKRGISLVIVTHHLDEIPPEVERVILLGNGSILADGAPERVLTAERLSQAYGVPIRVIRQEGRFFAAPEW
jgi:iron complex transport system ATP-binding protein